MRLHLTDGQSGLDVGFDDEEQAVIRSSKKPVSKALDITQKRIPECASGWWPIQGVALTGLENNND